MKTLVVGFHGWTDSDDPFMRGRAGGRLTPAFCDCLARSLGTEAQRFEVWCPDAAMGMFAMIAPESVAASMLGQIDDKIRADPPDSIVFVGFSAGSLIARRVLCMAHGVGEDAVVVAAAARPWAHRIDRMVVLAGITRGWDWTSESPALMRFFWPVLMGFTRLVGWLRRSPAAQAPGRPTPYHRLPFIWQLERGTPFVVATRLQYLALLRHLQKSAAPLCDEGRPPLARQLRAGAAPSTVFLLGAQDELVSPADCTELGPRAEFVYIELPDTRHDDAIAITGPSPVELMRRNRLAAAVAQPFEALKREPWSIDPADIDDYLDPMDLVTAQRSPTAPGPAGAGAEGHVRAAFIVVHGIRDHGFWTKRVAREIKVAARARGEKVAAATPSYGYFSAWDFVRPLGRERATRWFMERYADLKSHNPDAAISFVGHSNGTYIAARAIELCPAIRFERVVFAGSVVRRSFAWSLHRSQAAKVLNFVATDDAVVAFLPAVFERLQLPTLDVGGAGVWGFDEFRPAPDGSTASSQGHNVEFVRGGHGAAIKAQYWRSIAEFALDGEVPPPAAALRPGWLKALFGAAPLLTVPLVVAALALLLSYLLVPMGWALGDGFDRSDLGRFALVLLAGAAVSVLTYRILRKI